MCSKWSMLAEGDDWSFISYTLSCIMHKIRDVLSLPQAPAVMYRITIQNTRAELLVTVSTSLSKWEPGILQNPRVADSAMMAFWILPRPFTNTHTTQGKSQRGSGPHCSLIQNRRDNPGLFQNVKYDIIKTGILWRTKSEGGKWTVYFSQ